MTSPRCALIDHCNPQDLADKLRGEGIEVDTGFTLDDFLSRHDLSTYPVLLYHPGILQQRAGSINRVRDEYPQVRMALLIIDTEAHRYKLAAGEKLMDDTDVEGLAKYVREENIKSR
jgi:hypothetical protein